MLELHVFLDGGSIFLSEERTVVQRMTVWFPKHLFTCASTLLKSTRLLHNSYAKKMTTIIPVPFPAQFR
jgi:hypothetical protein